MDKYWEIDEGKVDAGKFFETLPKYFSAATTFFAEGTMMSDDVMECYASFSDEGKYLPGAQTILPISKKFRCKFSPLLMGKLATLAKKHSEPELLNHLFVYKGNEALLYWHDAFANVLLVSRSIPESSISEFASELGLKYGAAR